MGVFISLKLSENSLEKIKKLQDDIKLPYAIDKSDIHCTLFLTKENFEYKSINFEKIIINNIKLGKIKNQKGIDCLVLLFENDDIKQKYDDIKNNYKVTPYYQEFKLHITLSYDCGLINENEIDLKDYFESLEIISEEVKPLMYEVDRRKQYRKKE